MLNKGQSWTHSEPTVNPHTLHLRAQRRVQFGKKKAQLGGGGLCTESKMINGGKWHDQGKTMGKPKAITNAAFTSTSSIIIIIIIIISSSSSSTTFQSTCIYHHSLQQNHSKSMLASDGLHYINTSWIENRMKPGRCMAEVHQMNVNGPSHKTWKISKYWIKGDSSWRQSSYLQNEYNCLMLVLVYIYIWNVMKPDPESMPGTRTLWTSCNRWSRQSAVPGSCVPCKRQVIVLDLQQKPTKNPCSLMRNSNPAPSPFPPFLPTCFPPCK